MGSEMCIRDSHFQIFGEAIASSHPKLNFGRVVLIACMTVFDTSEMANHGKLIDWLLDGFAFMSKVSIFSLPECSLVSHIEVSRSCMEGSPHL